MRDVTGLSAERNAFRYLPVPVTIRAEAGADPVEVARVVLAATTAGAPVELSLAEDAAGGRAGGDAASASGSRTPPPGIAPRRGSATPASASIGGSAGELLAALGGRPDLAVYDGPVTASGRVELLPFLREQAVSITAHRFGTPSALVEALPLVAPSA